MAKCARILTENTAKISQGSYLKVEFEDFLHPPKKDERSGEEIVADIIKRAGIEVIA